MSDKIYEALKDMVSQFDNEEDCLNEIDYVVIRNAKLALSSHKPDESKPSAIYLVSFVIHSDNKVGHINISMDRWSDGNGTLKVMEFIADKHGYDVSDIVITSVFKLPDQ